MQLKKPLLVGLSGLVFGALIGLSAAQLARSEPDQNNPSQTELVDGSVPEQPNNQGITPRSNTIYEGEFFTTELPLEYGLVSDGVQTDLGFRSDFAAPNAVVSIEVAPSIEATTGLGIEQLAQNFASTQGSSTRAETINGSAVWTTNWRDGETSSARTQFFYLIGGTAVSVGLDASSPSVDTRILDRVVATLSLSEAATSPPISDSPGTSAEVVNEEVELPDDCLGDSPTTLTVINVDRTANARDRAALDGEVIAKVQLGEKVVWTGERVRNGRFSWHEIVVDGYDQCLWIAHTLLGP